MRLYDSGTSTRTAIVYDGHTRIAEYSSAGTQRARFVHGPGVDEPLVEYGGTGLATRTFLHADERGSIIAGTNDSGGVTAVTGYDEYGKAQNQFSRFGYTGQPYETVSELVDARARMYNPRLPRFMQPDPIGYGDGLYAYVKGDPVNLTDPTGMCTATDRNQGPNGCITPKQTTGSLIGQNGQYICASCSGWSSASITGSQMSYSVSGIGGGTAPSGWSSVTDKYRLGSTGIQHISSTYTYDSGFDVAGLYLAGAPSGQRFDEYVPFNRLPLGSRVILKDRVVLPGGKAVVMVDLKVFRMSLSNNGKGIVFSIPGVDRSSIRVQGPTQTYPGGYVRYMNSFGNYISPYSGRAGTDDQTHYPLSGFFVAPGR